MTPWASKHVSQRVRPSAPGRRLLPLPCRPCRPPGPEPTRPRGLRAAGSTAGSFLRGPRSPASSLLVSEAARVALLSAWSLKCSPCVYPALHGAPRSPPLLLRTHTQHPAADRRAEGPRANVRVAAKAFA